MFRFVICFFVPLFLPWGLWYSAYVFKKGRLPKRAPRGKLWAAGVFLAAAALSFFTVRERFPADSVYMPARYENGRLIPARFESPIHAD